MPNEPLNFRITATDEATPVVQRVDAETDALAEKVVNVNIGVTGGDTAAVAGEATAAAESLTEVEAAVSNMASSVSAALEALNGVAEGLVTVEEASTATATALAAVDETMAVLGPESALAAAAANELSAALAEMQAAAAAAAEESLALEEGATAAGTGLNFANRASTTGIRDLYRVGVIANSAGVSFAGLSTRVITSAVALAAFSNLGFVAAGAIVAGLFALGAVFDSIKGGTDEAAASAKELTKAYEELANTLPKSTDAAGALNEHLRTMLQSSPDLAKALVDLGTDGGGLADAIRGGVNPAIDTARQFMADYGTTVAAARAQSQGLSDAETQLAAKYGITTSALEKRLADSEQLVRTADAEAKANRDATDTTNTFAKATQGLSTIAADVAAAGALWAKANRDVDTSLNPDLWNRVAQAAHNLALGQSLSADETAAVLQAMSNYGLTSEQVLNEGKKLWNDNAKAAVDAAKATADAAAKSAAAVAKLQDDLTTLAAKYATVAAQAQVLQKTLDDSEQTAFRVHTAYADSEDAIGSFGEAIKKLVPDMKTQAAAWDRQNKTMELAGTHLTTFTKAGREALRATEELSKSVDTELTQAFVNAGGSQDKFVADAQRMAGEITKQLKAAGVAVKEIPNFLEALGLTDVQLHVRFVAAEKENALNLLQGIVSDLNGDLSKDPAFMLQLRLAMNSNDPVAGLAELIAHYKDNPAVLSAILSLIDQEPAAVQAGIQTWLAANGIAVTIPSQVGTPTPLDPAQVDPTGGKPLNINANLIPQPLDPKAVSDVLAGITGEPGAVNPLVPVGANMDPAGNDLDGWTHQIEGPAAQGGKQVDVPTHAATDIGTKEIDGWIEAQSSRTINVRVHAVPDSSVPGSSGGAGVPGVNSVHVTQNINAGFGTDRFALERAVRDANHKLNRLAGVRS